MSDTTNATSELAEIDENLKRNELTVLEQGDHLVRREQILQEKGLRAKVGDNQHRKGGSETGSPPRTTEDLAKEIGLTERSTQYRKQIATNIVPAVKEIIADTEVADSTKPLTLL